ncbi:type I polyketide synthase [Paraburkholderia caballeronis]|uniref:Acyl transferase domain-containing protein n=1 Tax=Paraburkholderia caballeronis TaxID=416943 RepID=A0A1H7HBM1_9BURK|nr:type I polyketide synthase [Paraburkholderia caballeronis]PXW29589.1 acyl transferase domain-containing protein [Paraburkholderia caballeronis]PXX04848.1 acyl transferase domain-containing protein [Paraburkholderia caballeronis]RAK05909.1 acyl transferase domain-containing protein [Paraburkholderia caballeronis]SEB43524.1 Acyl transferase domain-containing protein [Paraburkholderia caballeronis]SEK47157.1 Acyl transferase domain-containing protein [Paraburkholderia caballeronis]
MNKKIAIVGMACRFPGGVTGAEEFWRLLRDERDAVTEVPADRFGTEFYRHPSKREPGKSYTFAAGVLDDVAGFDATFFGISPREAAQMDPQQRLLLELAWEAFEDAGVRPRDMRGRHCAVYVGVASPDYGNRSMDDLNSVDPYSATGNTLSIASNRLSYLFDLRGPSMSVDTACSSSLVALHQAVLALQSGEAECALAGGVNLLTHPFGFVSFSKASMLSPRGRCRAFDASGDGYVRAEGGALVLLKPLERALADGDTIHAVIAGSGVNSDGYSQGGISVPGAATQAALLRSVYERAGVAPQSLAYLEAHGTGTAVGDPIEARALIDVVARGREADDPLLIGSVKTNIGHLETASGMAGLIKAVLCLKHRAVPRSLHFEYPNPNIDFHGGRLRVVDRFTPLTVSGKPLTVGVNSFGFGGTNAHVVLIEAPAEASPVKASGADSMNRSLAPLVISARVPRALNILAGQYLRLLDDGASWHALAAGAARRRQWFEHRAIVAPMNSEEARAALAALATPTDEPLPAAVVQGEAAEDGARVALVFSGNGSQWAGMGKQLIASDAVFRAALVEVDTLWCADGSAPLVDMLITGIDDAQLAATEYAQPVLFAIQVGIVRAIEARGVAFDACVGHSVGEVAAAWAAGALTLSEAVHVIKIRSRAQAQTRGTGRMAAAGVGETAASELITQLGLAGAVEVAGSNSPQSVTLAGSFDGLQVVGSHLRDSGRFFQMLELDYAFHSSRMDGIEATVREKLADIVPRHGDRLFVSTVTGAPLSGTALDAGYWWWNIRKPVRFGDAVAQLVRDGVRVFVEVGPHSILRTYVKQTLESLGVAGHTLPTLKRHQDSASMLHHAIVAVVANGARVDPDRFAPDAPRVALPSYPWQRERYWLEPSAEAYNLVNRRREHPLLGYRLHEHAFGWENQLDPIGLPLLADHVVDGAAAFPGAGYVEMALAAARVFLGTQTCALENVEIRSPVVFQSQHAKLFRLMIDPRTAAFTIETRDRMSAEPWALNVTGRMLASGSTLDASCEVPAATLSQLLAQPALNGDDLYASTAAIGLAYGPAFRWISSVRVAGDEALADVTQPQGLTDTTGSGAWLLHPALMDSGFHPLFALLSSPDSPSVGDHAAYVPVQLGRIDFLRGDTVHRVLARIERRNPHSVTASFEFIDACGKIVARLAACRFRRIDLLGRRLTPPARYAYVLDAKPLPDGFDATALPSPAQLVEAAATTLATREDPARREGHLTEILPLIDVLASAYALRALDAIDAFSWLALPRGEHAELVSRLAGMVVEDGFATWDGTRLVRDMAACDAMPGPDELWRALLAQSPAHVAELTLMAHCGAALPAVLRGELEAREVISLASGSLVEHFFEASPTWAHVLSMMAVGVEQAVDGWGESRRLRVLEVPTSNGDILRPLDVRLPVARCDHAIACTPQQQSGFDIDSLATVRTVVLESGERLKLDADDGAPYDMVLANRVLAGRDDALAALSAMRGWLAPGGLIVIAEGRGSRFADIVFGLQSAASSEAGARVPLTPPEVMRLLEQAGFENAVRYVERGLELEGAPLFIVARVPAADGRPQRGVPAPALVAARREERWLLLPALGDQADGAELASVLRQAGCDVSSATPQDAPRLVAARSSGVKHRLVFIAPDHALPADVDGAVVMSSQHDTSIALARLVRELGIAAPTAALQLVIVTYGGAPYPGVTRSDAALRPEQATLWGLGRVLANEHPELGCRLIDVHPACPERFAALAHELLASDGEEDVLLSSQGRFVPRMLTVAEALARAPEGAGALPPASMLAFAAPGSLRNLEWFALPERELGPDEIEIEPVATGLNFRDVMYAMGLLSDEAVESGFAGATIGMELSGRVVRTGRDVSGFVPGDAVLGFAPASFATRVRTCVAAIAHKPGRLTFEEAATIPTTFFTAYYALFELARLRHGERVLVHGGAGGVGIAAIQLARHFGAEVFATAGSREKREFVRLLGADHVLDSRSLAFADDIRALTGGTGVDVVVNSLAGEAMVRSIDTLRPFGRFIELGKRDFYENSFIGLRPFRNNISYFGIDADQLMGALPELTARLFGEVMQLFESGVLHPLPYRAFPAARVEEAFRYMQQARQIGKVLVTYQAGIPAPSHDTLLRAEWRLDPLGTYLVVGGTGGLGFATTRRFVERGAMHLTLASRGGSLPEAMQAEVGRWREERGVRVDVVTCDVTDAAAVGRLIGGIEARGMPLKGIVHSAMQIDDSLVRNLDDDRFAAVLAPKVAGAWNLHRATRGCALDFFVVYSSATTFLGNPGQASYVAANSFLEALVEQRRAAGLPGTFMAWGPLDDVGFLARHAQTREALQARIGGASITSAEALAALERVLLDGRAGEAVVRLDWQAIARGMPAAGARRYVSLRTRNISEPLRDSGVQLRGQIRSLRYDQAVQLVEETLQAQIARILHMPPDRIELEKSVSDMGMDSLMGMELGMAVEETFEVKLSVMAIAEGATVRSLAARITGTIVGADDGGLLQSDVAQEQMAMLAAQHAVDGEARALIDAGSAHAVVLSEALE